MSEPTSSLPEDTLSAILWLLKNPSAFPDREEYPALLFGHAALRAAAMEQDRACARGLFALSAIGTVHVQLVVLGKHAVLYSPYALLNALQMACLSGSSSLLRKVASAIPPVDQWWTWQTVPAQGMCGDREDRLRLLDILWTRVVADVVLERLDELPRQMREIALIAEDEELRKTLPDAGARGLKVYASASWIAAVEAITERDEQAFEAAMERVLQDHRDSVREGRPVHEWLPVDWATELSIYGLMLCKLAMLHGLSLQFTAGASAPGELVKCARGKPGLISVWAESQAGVLPLQLIHDYPSEPDWGRYVLDLGTFSLDWWGIYGLLQDRYPDARADLSAYE